jgi:predicted dehydrogenase
VTGGGGTTAPALAAELKCDYEPSLQSLLARADVDAVIVATPNYLHTEPVCLAAEHGKHVFLEKPMALSVRDCDAMIAALRAGGVIFMLGTMMHYYEGFVRIKEAINRGEIGRPMVAFAARTGWQLPEPVIPWKKMQAMSGGHLFHHIHEIDLLRWFVGDVRSVFARARNFAHVGEGYGDEDDVVLLSLEFTNGAFGTMEYGSGFHFGEHVVKISGSQGAFLVDNARSKIVQRTLGGRDVEFDLFDDPEANESMIALFREADGGIAFGRQGDLPRHYLARAIRMELDAFIRAVTDGVIEERDRWMFDPLQGRAAVAVAEGALQSARTGQPVLLVP